jgi:uncharacterized membrane protein HdeD (DUF308 family)
MKMYERLSFLFTGIAYIVVGILVITQPRFFYFWVAAIFLIQGIVSFIRAFSKTKED